jgi:hypothetical protein
MHRALARLLGGGLTLFAGSVCGAGCLYLSSKWPTSSAAMYVATAMGGTFIGAYQQATQVWDTDTVFGFSVAQDPSSDGCSSRVEPAHGV